MMTQDRDYEDALRRALTAAAESIEPAGDGLQRIRHRLDSPRSPRSVLSACTEWLELRGTRFLIRLEPVTEAGRTALRRSRPLAALVSFLRGLLSPRAAQGAGRAGGHRGATGSPGRLGPAGPWLKPVFAVSAAVAIVVVGVVILNHETGTLIRPTYSVTRPTSQGSSLGGGEAGKSKRWTPPLGVRPAQQLSGRTQDNNVPSGLPAVACTPTPSPSPTATASATPTPTPSPSGVVTTPPATPQPSDSGTPSPTPSASTATGGTGTTAAHTMAVRTMPTVVLSVDAGGPIVECGTGTGAKS
jgi:hypothetical protein